MMPHLKTLAASCLAIAGMAASATAQQPKNAPAQKMETPEQAVVRAMDESWPDHPEWLDQLTEILQETPMGPNTGWFRRAVAQTRFDWNAVRKRLDANGDGAISRKEFSGSDQDFARLDRDRDGGLTKNDFDFSAHALAPSPGSLFQFVLDEDGNGKITREEMEAFFTKSDSGKLGFLSLNDLQDNFRAQAKPPVANPAPPPSKETLVRGLFTQEIGSLQPGPSLGDEAPDFTLKSSDGKSEVNLKKLIGPKPVVLVFGNFTCGPFRMQAGNVEKLYRLYKDRVDFVMVYVREAHPTDGWRMDGNDQVGIATAQPRTYDERATLAKSCGTLLGLGFPMVVDTIDDTVGSKYSGMPSRLYLIDRDGKVAYKSGRGPYGFKPSELEHSLLLLLEQDADKTPKEQPHALAPPTEGTGPFKMLSDAAAWKRLPDGIKGGGQILPNWAKATAHALPRTTASMLELDLLHRTQNPLGPILRGKMRWVAADANRCESSRATAEADLRRAGATDDDIAALKGSPDRWPTDEVAALEFASQMSIDASKITDVEVERLREKYGDAKLVAMVQLMAMANFQDRLILGLGVGSEADGVLRPVAVQFAPIASTVAVPPRAKPEDLHGPLVPVRVDDPEWGTLSFDMLQKNLDVQKDNPGRVRVPSSEEVVAGLPADYPKPKSPMRVKWSLVCFGYQPRLAIAWSNCMKSFKADAKLDEVFAESLFWVVTRTIRCFY